MSPLAWSMPAVSAASLPKLRDRLTTRMRGRARCSRADGRACRRASRRSRTRSRSATRPAPGTARPTSGRCRSTSSLNTGTTSDSSGSAGRRARCTASWRSRADADLTGRERDELGTTCSLHHFHFMQAAWTVPVYRKVAFPCCARPPLALAIQVVMAPSASRRAANGERHAGEQRRQRPELEARRRLSRIGTARQFDLQQPEQRPVNDQAGIALGSGDVGLVVVDAVTVEGERREPEQQHGIRHHGLRHGGIGRRGLGAPRPSRRAWRPRDRRCRVPRRARSLWRRTRCA